MLNPLVKCVVSTKVEISPDAASNRQSFSELEMLGPHRGVFQKAPGGIFGYEEVCTMSEKGEDECLCKPTEILIFPCSGGSNVGQIANDAGLELTVAGRGKMYCLAGIGGRIDGLIEATRAAKRIVAVDGCPVQCAKKTLDHAGFTVDVHSIVTELGIEKGGALAVSDADVRKVSDHIISKLQQ
jgi:uncharacterized metal-binding protein